MAKVFAAAEKKEWEKVEVRRPLEAVVYSECGPSRAVRLGLGQWTLEAFVARRTRPCYAGSSPYVRRQFRVRVQALLRAGQDATFRDSYAPLPSCRVSRFLAASFARNRRFHDFPKFGTLDGCASGVRDGDCSESSRSTLYR